MNKSKQWVLITIATTIVFLTFVGAVIFIVDPFFHFHKPLQGLAYSIDNQAYTNPGIVRNFSYDSVITGSSMTENFKPSEFKEILGLDAVKVPYSGGTAKNMNVILDLALQHNQGIKEIFLGLDISMLEKKPSATRVPLPQYLYNKNVLDDVNYALNKAVLFGQVEAVLDRTRQGGQTISFDDAYFWEPLYKFNENVVTESYLASISQSSYRKPPDINVTKANLEANIIPLIVENHQIEFHIFFPPYSILFWHMLAQSNTVDATIVELDYVVESLLQYDNVKLYYFQNIEEIVGNLYLYKDYTHYNAQINSYMLHCFANGEQLLTKNNYKDELQKMKLLATNFDYDIFFGNKIPLKQEEEIYDYFNLLKNDNYVTILSVKVEPFTQFADQTVKALNGLGIQKACLYTGASNYIGIVDGENVTYDKMSALPLEFKTKIGGLDVGATSGGSEAPCSIKINGVEYSKNTVGLNIVVYDKSLKRVVDSICVDPKPEAAILR